MCAVEHVKHGMDVCKGSHCSLGYVVLGGMCVMLCGVCVIALGLKMRELDDRCFEFFIHIGATVYDFFR